MNRQNSYSAPSESDEILAELLTLTCVVDELGTIRYLNSEGQLHRVHGPAVIYKDGRKRWFQMGEIEIRGALQQSIAMGLRYGTNADGHSVVQTHWCLTDNGSWFDMQN